MERAEYSDPHAWDSASLLVSRAIDMEPFAVICDVEVSVARTRQGGREACGSSALQRISPWLAQLETLSFSALK
jgi:hypothetical protein